MSKAKLDKETKLDLLAHYKQVLKTWENAPLPGDMGMEAEEIASDLGSGEYEGALDTIREYGEALAEKLGVKWPY